MDRSLLFVVAALSLFGVIMVFSASAPYALREYGDPQYFFWRDLAFTGVGFVLMLIVSRIDYNHYRKWATVLFVLAYLSTLASFVPGIRAPLNQAYRWIRLFGITYMPSDGLKLASIVFLAAQLTTRPLSKNGTGKTLVAVLLLIGITVIPVAKQPNFSAVIVITASLLFVYLIGGMNLWHLLPLSVLGVAFLTLAFWPREGNYRLDRLLIVLNPMRDPQGDGWQLLQSLYSVASGGLFGVGYGQSRQKFGYLADEPHNDFIFSVISEELGFVGAVTVIAAFMFLAFRGVKAAQHARNPFGKLVGFGLTFLISFQAMVNIGVAIGLVPTTGITLPFVSYGGSSLLVMSVIAGILLNISRDAKGTRYDRT
ncbi:MAG: putative lipid II flippase FtsW [Peptoniphilaceae bacterium]|nr:putative lipid II flippase FtsW [Peptoniphilaceae bacterium]